MAFNNLYPPIIDVAMPAFIKSESPKINFSLSKYNSPNEIDQMICVSITDHATNESYFNTPSGVKFFQMSSDKTSFNLDASTLKDGEWQVGKIYKLQVRFLKLGEKAEDSISNILALQEAGALSEWSTVCLLKPIEEPQLNLRLFNEDGKLDNGKYIFKYIDKIFTGRVEFSDNEELESYKIEIYNSQEKVYDSGIIYSDVYATNEINHKIYYGFIDGVDYTLHFTYTTSNGYTKTTEYNFMVLNLGGERFRGTITATPNPWAGNIEIKIFSNKENYIGNLVIKRASSKDNFTFWEDVQFITITSARQDIDITWEDYTIESGVWYKYCVQKIDLEENRGLVVMIEKPVMVIFDDMFLCDQNRFLKIRFNPQIGSYTRTLSETSSQTIGSKYPFIKRNGNVNYRQFTISGLISHLMDEDGLFTSRAELLDNQVDLYENYNYKNRITDYNDFILERKFREKVEEFLCDGKVKLFKSTPEGTLLVRLMNVSLTPENTLGRMLYSFSATAYEIDEVSLANLDKYNLYQTGEIAEVIIGEFEASAQIQLTSFDQSLNNELVIQESDALKDSIYSLEISEVKRANIVLDAEPYITTNELVGYEVSVEFEDGVKTFYIPPKYIEDEYGNFKVFGELFLDGEDLKIKDIKIAKGVNKDEVFNGNVLIECTYKIIETPAAMKIPEVIKIKEQTGQIRGVFPLGQDIIEILREKYEYKDDDKEVTLIEVSSVKIEADPYTVFYKKDSFSNEYDSYIIGEGSRLEIKEDAAIEGLHVGGVYSKKENKIEEIPCYVIIDYCCEIEEREY